MAGCGCGCGACVGVGAVCVGTLVVVSVDGGRVTRTLGVGKYGAVGEYMGVGRVWAWALSHRRERHTAEIDVGTGWRVGIGWR